MSACPTPATDSYLQIDNFLIEKLFQFARLEQEINSVRLRAATGRMHVKSRFQKDHFRLFYPRLIQSESDEIAKIMQQVGIDALHVVRYSTPEIMRVWDDATPAGYNVNSDTTKIRGKIWIDSWEMPHLDGHANEYELSIVCIEA